MRRPGSEVPPWPIRKGATMELTVLRQVFTSNSTIGQLLVNGRPECFTLEDVVRPSKIYGETAIPSGTYRLVVTHSPRFKVRLPLLVDVPGYSGVRIHPGNTKADTLGCLLVGQSKSVDSIGASRAAFAALMTKIEAAAQVEEVLIKLVDDRAAAGTATRSRSAGGAGEVQLGTPWLPPPIQKKRVRKARPKKSAAARKSVAKKPRVKKRAARKSTTGKALPRRAAVKKTVTKKAAAKKTAAKKAPAKKAPARKRAAPRSSRRKG